MRNLIPFIFGTLLTASLMWPSEGAIHGDGLYLVIAWLICGAYCVWHAARLPRNTHSVLMRRERLAAGAVIILIAGTWLSTWQVFQSPGNRRAALNLAFEWTALGTAWWVARMICREAGGRQFILTMVIVLGIGSAVLGVCQHHITFPGKAEWYLQQRAKLESANDVEGMQNPLERAAASAEFQRLGIPTSGPERELFERRLLASTEPTGSFALANSLGGLLAVVFVVFVSSVVAGSANGQRSLLTKLGLTIVFLVVVYCLLLTKSRTAWAGCFVGLVAVWLQRRGTVSGTRLRPFMLTGMFAVAGTVVTGVLTGAIDKEVVLESPRSLQFRLLYWMGTADVIKEYPVFGTGPGNFRNAYLTLKAAEASEEILDPHNIVLDAWATVGIAGLGGIVLLIVSAFCRSPHFENEHAEAGDSLQSHRIVASKSLPLRAILSGFTLHSAWLWIQGGDFDLLLNGQWLEWDNALWVLPVAAIVAIPIVVQLGLFRQNSAVAAFAAMVVHLLGAGGLQITGVILLLLVIHAAATTTVRKPSERIGPRESGMSLSRLAVPGLSAAALIVAAILTIRYGAIPVLSSQRHITSAEVRELNGNSSAALNELQLAIQEDPLAVESRQQKARLLTYSLLRVERLNLSGKRNGPTKSTEDHGQQNQTARIKSDTDRAFDMALAAANDFIEADRRGWNGYYVRSQVLRIRSDKRPLDSGVRNAVDDMLAAVERYPTNAQLSAELAESLNEAGRVQASVDVARRAMRQEEINRDWGHVDRYLDSEVLERLQKITVGLRP